MDFGRSQSNVFRRFFLHLAKLAALLEDVLNGSSRASDRTRFLKARKIVKITRSGQCLAVGHILGTISHLPSLSSRLSKLAYKWQYTSTLSQDSLTQQEREIGVFSAAVGASHDGYNTCSAISESKQLT